MAFLDITGLLGATSQLVLAAGLANFLANMVLGVFCGEVFVTSWFRTHVQAPMKNSGIFREEADPRMLYVILLHPVPCFISGSSTVFRIFLWPACLTRLLQFVEGYLMTRLWLDWMHDWIISNAYDASAPAYSGAVFAITTMFPYFVLPSMAVTYSCFRCPGRIVLWWCFCVAVASAATGATVAHFATLWGLL